MAVMFMLKKCFLVLAHWDEQAIIWHMAESGWPGFESDYQSLLSLSNEAKKICFSLKKKIMPN